MGPGRVSHLWFGFEFGKFPLKIPNFSIFFPLGQKNLFETGQKVPGSKASRPLIYCGSKVMLGSGQGPSLLTRLEIPNTYIRKFSSNWQRMGEEKVSNTNSKIKFFCHKFLFVVLFRFSQ